MIPFDFDFDFDFDFISDFDFDLVYSQQLRYVMLFVVVSIRFDSIRFDSIRFDSIRFGQWGMYEVKFKF